MYRTTASWILENIDKKEILILLGPRQVGKTTILRNLFPDNAIYIDLDDKVYRDFFDSLSIVKYRSYISSQLGAYTDKKDKVILILDEAQRLKDPGLTAKLFYDEIHDVKVILTGSSTLDIKKRTSESLAGRKTTLQLFPLTFQEYLVQEGILRENQIHPLDFEHEIPAYDDITKAHITEHLLERMRVGLYPGVLHTSAELYLHELIEAVILKDIFYLNLVKNTDGLISLLHLLAEQTTQLVNISDTAKRLGIARQTVSDYMDILEKSYIIFTLVPYKRERNDEIGKYVRVYFYDTGIRNALLNDFRPVNARGDFSLIFTNFMVAELKKRITYEHTRHSMYYWKTTQGAEIEVVLEKDTLLTGINIRPDKEQFSRGFMNTYPDAHHLCISMHNYENFLC